MLQFMPHKLMIDSVSEGGNSSHGSGPIPLRVLVVDDNPAAAQTLGWMLELFGHEVHLAHDGAGALKVAAETAPHLVLMDLELPGMDGCEACARLRAMPGLKHTLFAAQTGWDTPFYRKKSQDAGFEHHLVKPVEIETLRGLLQDAARIQAALSPPTAKDGM